MEISVLRGSLKCYYDSPYFNQLKFVNKMTHESTNYDGVYIIFWKFTLFSHDYAILLLGWIAYLSKCNTEGPNAIMFPTPISVKITLICCISKFNLLGQYKE